MIGTVLWRALVMTGAFSSVVLAANLDDRQLIEQALDESAAIVLEDISLRDAVDAITEQTGVRLVMPPEVMKLAPYGGDTLIQRVDIANVSLRKGLTELLSPLGMTFRVEDDQVVVVPGPALERLARAPTWAELDTISQLAAFQPGIDAAAREALRTKIRFEVPVRQAWSLLADAIGNVGAGAGDKVLTVACELLGWAWYPADATIVIVPKQRLIQQKLQRPISLRMNSRTLIDVLQAVARVAGVEVRAEPGAVNVLPLNVQRNFSINVYEQSGEQVLDQIAAYTGLGYFVEPAGVVFFDPRSSSPGAGMSDATGRPEAPPTVDNGRRPRGATPSIEEDPVVAQMPITLEDGRTVEWLIRRSELPEDLRAKRESDLAGLFDSIRRQDP